MGHDYYDAAAYHGGDGCDQETKRAVKASYLSDVIRQGRHNTLPFYNHKTAFYFRERYKIGTNMIKKRKLIDIAYNLVEAGGSNLWYINIVSKLYHLIMYGSFLVSPS